MKKVLFAVIAACTVLTAATAQSIKYGAKAGVNFATLNVDDDAIDTSIKTSFHVGGVAEIMISEKFYFQPELLFSSQGASYESSGFGITDGKLIASYLNLPLMGKFYPVEGFSIQAGPQVGLLLSAKDKYEIMGVSQEEDVKDSFKSIDFGVNLGLGYALPSGLFIDARYNLGLSDINDSDGGPKINNGVIQVSVGFLF
jgi:hypothetical protein